MICVTYGTDINRYCLPFQLVAKLQRRIVLLRQIVTLSVSIRELLKFSRTKKIFA